MFEAMSEETVLLLHDLNCDFQNRPRPLLQTAGQPVRILQAFRHVALVVELVAARETVAT